MQPSKRYPAAIAFAETARAFCGLVESAPSFDRRELAKRCLRILPTLISQALELRDAGKLCTHPDRITTESWQVVFRNLRTQFAEWDGYQKIFDPYETGKPEPLKGSIADDLAGTWQDLRLGLMVLDAGSSANAIAEWRFSFEYHRGPNHAIHVLRPLFSLVFADE